MTKRRDLGTYQMLWDCAYCDTTKLLALDHRHCPNCGGAQDAERRYFPSDEDKVAVEDHEFFGADWQCAACDSPNALPNMLSAKDLAAWQANYSEVVPLAANSTAVPEPTTGILLLMGMLSMLCHPYVVEPEGLTL